MRVVSGSARGRRLHAPAGLQIRPTSDRVRESVFNMLESLRAVRGATVADLFAGTGALGIEALSRGASAVTFVDEDPLAVATVRRNLEATGVAGGGGGSATLVRTEVLSWVERAPAFDLVLADPPYAFDAWPALLARLRTRLAVLESDREVDVGDRWEVLRSRRYGGTVVVVAHPSDTPWEIR